MEFSRPNLFYRLLHRFYRISVVSWLMSVVLPPLDRFFFWITRRKLSLAQLLSGLPVVLIGSTGAKSGKQRSTPLIAIPVGENRESLIVIASNFGKSRNPAWYYNMIADPKITVTYGGEIMDYVAHEVKDDDLYAEYWETAVNYYSGYRNYKRKTSRDHIPIVQLDPADIDN